MSARIEEIIEVIEYVRENFRNQTGYNNITNIRRKGEKVVAGRLKIGFRTVSDKFRRQLQPYVRDTHHFDKLLEDWLINDSDELRNFLLERVNTSRKIDSSDIELINNTFYKVPESENFLAQEFGYNPNEKPFKEGKEQLRLHLTKERKSSLVKDAKAKWNWEQNGHIHCSVCSFSFSEYGYPYNPSGYYIS